MEQAIIWAGLDGPKALPGKTVLELGCAPGGATLALLRHGMNVVGVDTADLDPRVVAERAEAAGFAETSSRGGVRTFLMRNCRARSTCWFPT